MNSSGESYVGGGAGEAVAAVLKNYSYSVGGGAGGAVAAVLNNYSHSGGGGAGGAVAAVLNNYSYSVGGGVGGAVAAVLNNYSYSVNDTEANCHYESEEDEFDIAFRFYMNGVLLNVIGAFGIVGNVISMIILSRPQMRSSINYLLIGLARCDTVLIVTSILLFGLTGLYPYTKILYGYYYYIYPYLTVVVYPLACVAQTVSVYLTLTVTVERFVAVCHPLRARSLCTYGRARFYVLAIVIFSFLYNLPKFWESEVGSESHLVHGVNVTVFCIQAADFRNDYYYVTVYIHWMYLIFMYILPFGSLAILNALIYKQVRRANAERQRLSRIQRREIGLATMLLIVVLVFFACNLLALVTNTLESFSSGPLTVLNPLVKTSNLLVTINSSVNFVIYVIFGEKFKRLFLKIFCAHGLLAAVGGGRDSPDAATHDDSLVSNGDRYSVRLHRHNTACSKNGSLHLANNNGVSAERRSLRVSRAPSPGPVVYYPRQNRLHRPSSYSTALTASTDTTSTQF